VKLGILVNTARHLDDVIGLTEAAIAKGREVFIFAMDEGTRLLDDRRFASLACVAGVTMSVCEHSAKSQHVNLEHLAPQIRCGSQLNNATMVHAADRVIVL
jgi:predicted peroxiredoxin